MFRFKFSGSTMAVLVDQLVSGERTTFKFLENVHES